MLSATLPVGDRHQPQPGRIEAPQVEGEVFGDDVILAIAGAGHELRRAGPVVGNAAKCDIVPVTPAVEEAVDGPQQGEPGLSGGGDHQFAPGFQRRRGAGGGAFHAGGEGRAFRRHGGADAVPFAVRGWGRDTDLERPEDAGADPSRWRVRRHGIARRGLKPAEPEQCCT